jgi:hypothetical protein
LRGEWVFLLGVLRNLVCRTWFFGGAFVVECVVNVVFKHPLFGLQKMCQLLKIYFQVGLSCD